MKAILWATLTANGNYQRNDPQHPPPPEALADFAHHARETGNFIVGRKTFEGFAAQQAAQQAPSSAAPRAPDGGGMGPPTIVVVSKTPPAGVPSAAGPTEALALLRERGFSTALIAGGETLHNACLASDLVDELVFNIAPVFEDEGFKLRLPRGTVRALTLIESRPLGGGVVQLRYRMKSR